MLKEATMTKWEYKTVPIPPHIAAEVMNNWGWSACSAPRRWAARSPTSSGRSRARRDETRDPRVEIVEPAAATR
jgi:hypothetical protein